MKKHDRKFGLLLSLILAILIVFGVCYSPTYGAIANETRECTVTDKNEEVFWEILFESVSKFHENQKGFDLPTVCDKAKAQIESCLTTEKGVTRTEQNFLITVCAQLKTHEIYLIDLADGLEDAYRHAFAKLRAQK